MRAGWRVSAVLIALAIASAGVWGGPAAAQDRSYRIAEVRVDATLRTDGSLAVVEDRVFRYSGTFFGAFYELPLRDGQQVSSFALSDSTGVTYRSGTCSQEGDREPGAYEIEQSRRRFRVTWCYGTPATDQDRTYRLSYVVSRAGTRHADAAQLYWQWVGTGWEVPTDRVVADVRLPGGEALVAGQDLLVWGHGPLTGRVDVVEPGLVRTEVEGLPPATFVELRALMPADVLAEAPSDGREVREAILAEERCFAAAADAERARARGEQPTRDCDPLAGRHRAANVGLLTALALGGLAWGTAFVRHGREYALPPGLGEYERELPAQDPPALVDWLLNWGSTGDKALVSTIMDLARRGHITFDRGVERRRGLIGSKDEEVVIMRRGPQPDAAFERDVMRLLFDKAGNGTEVSDAELKKWVAGHRDSAYSWWTSWTADIEQVARKRHWVEPKVWVGIGVLVGVALMALAVGLAVTLGAAAPIAVATGLAGLVMTVFSPLMRRRTREGRVLDHRWRRLGAFLRDYSLLPERGPEHLALWGTYLVYAVPLGVADEVMRNLDARLSAAEMQTVSGVYYPLIHTSSGRPSLAGGLGRLSAAIPAATIAASPSSSSGGGGGFSGGGGGGGGGSGGGAF